MQFKLKRI